MFNRHASRRSRETVGDRHARRSTPHNPTTQSRGYRSRCDQSRFGVLDLSAPDSKGASFQAALCDRGECRDRHLVVRTILAALSLSHADLLEHDGNRLAIRHRFHCHAISAIASVAAVADSIYKKSMPGSRSWTIIRDINPVYREKKIPLTELGHSHFLRIMAA